MVGVRNQIVQKCPTILIQFFLFLIISDTNGLKRSETLDPNGKFHVSWEVEDKTGTIIFEVLASTVGYVGFGISPSGGMTGADIVIGGVLEDGSFYFEDRFAEHNGLPIIDRKQDWTLLESKENDTFTYLKFSRLIATCDSQDVEITGDAQRFIWAMGQDDNINYHEANRGSFFVNILDPPAQEINLDEYESFDAIVDVTLTSKSSAYMCSVHRSPSFRTKRHTVAFRPKLLSPKAKKYTHHLSVYKCTAPEGEDPEEFFEKFIIYGGQDCFGGSEERSLEIYEYCTHIFYSWALGAKVMQMPEGIGFPISEGGREYFMMEMHLNNPESHHGISFQSGVEMFLSTDLRPMEAGIFAVGIESNWKLLIPPSSSNLKVATHCTQSCTNFIKPEGYTLFNVQLHAHSSARKMRLRHFRDGTELPWIVDDQTYDNNFQSYRNINPVKLLPGDHLTLECWYDNTWIHPPSTVLGGYSTREEMCDAMIYYYPKGRLSSCSSENVGSRLMKLFGIQQLSRRAIDKANPMIIAPREYKGKRLIEHMNTMVNWTSSFRKIVQEQLLVGPQKAYCVIEGFENDNIYEDVTGYPEINQVYEKSDECLSRNNI